MKHKGTVTLATPRLTLRRFCVEDARAMYVNWASDPDVTMYLTWPTHTDIRVSGAVIDSWIREYENDAYYQWAVVLEGQPIGSISVVSENAETETVQIGYCIGKHWWHQGITTEALQAVIRFFFEEVGAKRIEARHDPNNAHSGGVMRKCGMRYEGTLRQADRNNQGICDVSWYSILREEYEF